MNKIGRLISCVQKKTVFGRDIYFKRDDLIKETDCILSGNKARKFYDLLCTDHMGSSVIGSYGGVQSNSMLAIAKVAVLHKKQFVYFSRAIPTRLKRSPAGCFKQALDLGMQVIEVSNEDYNSLHAASPSSVAPAVARRRMLECTCSPAGEVSTGPVGLPDVHWVPQGGYYREAQSGVRDLARELHSFIEEVDTAECSEDVSDSAKKKKSWKILFASGTGTTALFAAQWFRQHCPGVEVIALPCAGSAAALQHQMAALDAATEALQVYPTVLADPGARRHAFAKPCPEHFALWSALCRQTGMLFDLVYAPRAWEIVVNSALLGNDGATDSSLIERVTGSDGGEVLKDWLPDSNIIYYHCGGIEGNESQLERYSTLGLQ